MQIQKKLLMESKRGNFNLMLLPRRLNTQLVKNCILPKTLVFVCPLTFNKTLAELLVLDLKFVMIADS